MLHQVEQNVITGLWRVKWLEGKLKYTAHQNYGHCEYSVSRSRAADIFVLLGYCALSTGHLTVKDEPLRSLEMLTGQ